ncbi:MAG: TolC family protein [Bacteroidales bacterium]
MKNNILILIVFLPLIVEAQLKKNISFDQYIEQVQQKNIAYAAEKLNISIADANITSAKIFLDPSLSVEYAYNDDHRMQMGQGISAELSKTFSVGKRKVKIDFANKEKERDLALLEDYFRNLRAEASITYLEAIKQEKLYEVQLKSYYSISELAKGDSIRFVLGKITAVDALQSRIEADIIYNELLQAQSELYHAYAALYIPMGQFNADTLYVPIGSLNMRKRIWDLLPLLSQSLENRSDLVASLKEVELAQKALKLAKREKNIDFDVALGYNYNTEVRNELAPAPKFQGLTLSVSIPLKFSNFNKGSVSIGNLQARQAENHYEQAQLEIKTEVSQNYHAYQSFCKQVENFTKGILEEAKAGLDGKIYSYQRGENSLLEVLDARRTYNNVQSTYIETLFQCALSLIEIEKSVGIWDIKVEP